MSHLDAGTATHALPRVSDAVFSKVTELVGILLRGCLNFTERLLGDESFCEQGPRYIELLLLIPQKRHALREKRQLGDEDKLYNNYTSSYLNLQNPYISQDAVITGRTSLADPRRSAAKPNWENRPSHIGLGPKPKWEGPKPKWGRLRHA